VTVIHNGISPSEFEKVRAEPDAADFLFIGELRQLKGVSTLIDAANQMGLRIHIRIVGSGPDQALFERQASQSKSGVRIDFLGPMPARRAFALARAVVLPSHHESLPYVALEAAGAGIPLVATRVGGLSEIFGKDAVHLVEPHNSNALAIAMRQTMLREEEAYALAERLQKRVKEEFSLQHMVNGVIEFYERLVQAKAIANDETMSGNIPFEPEVMP
jgi:glycosyltransferase involved in cell wall biosynthesis